MTSPEFSNQPANEAVCRWCLSVIQPVVDCDHDDTTDQMILGQVVITRVLTDEDIVDHVIATTPDGDEIALAEALGMMRLAEDTLIRSRLDDD